MLEIHDLLYRGRADESREEVERRCYDLLDGLGIEYRETLRMPPRFRHERQLHGELLLQFLQNPGVLRPQTLHHLRGDDDFRHDLAFVDLCLAEDRLDLALHLDGNGKGAFDHAVPGASGAFRRQLRKERLLLPLAAHL